MENSTSIVNTTYVNDDDGISATLFNFLVFFLPIPAIASLMLCCCFIGIARSNKPLSAQSSCKYDNGIIKVSDLTKTRDLKERTGCICDRCFIFVVVIPMFFSLAFFSYDLIPVSYMQVPYMVVCLQIVVLTVMYVWFEMYHFIKLDTDCGEIMANLKRQKVELLIYKNDRLLQCSSDMFQWEDKSYFENSPRRNGNDGRPIKFNVKVCVNVFTADPSRKMFFKSLTVLQHRLFDPNNINYTFTSHKTPLPLWTRTEFRLLMRCVGLGYVWKSRWDRYVQHATLHINKCVYLTDSLTENHKSIHLRIQDLSLDVVGFVTARRL